MVDVLILLSLTTELLMYHKRAWKYRMVFVFGLTILIPAVTSLYLLEHISALGMVVALLSVGRLYNLFRIAKARMHTDYLRASTQRTAVITGLLQLAVLLPANLISFSAVSVNEILIWLAYVQLLVAVCIVSMTVRNVYKTRYRQGTTFFADKELPTVSVLIPARNETNDLEECLRSVIASNYPKLEIIVLDDCSQAKTSDIIKSFAQDGVRFVPGKPPNDNWLAKNQAYHKLADEASGELLLFCGVDVRFGQNAIRALVTELQNRKKDMIGILPHRLSGSVAGAFIQPMRYWWELALPRKLFNRPAVLSTCWVIKSDSLSKLGGFGAVSHSILPEGFFARQLVTRNAYSFIRANETLDIQTCKSLSEQRATAIRTRYPQLRRRPENAMFLVYAELLLLLGPFVGVLYGLTTGNQVLYASIGACVLLVFNHVLIMQLTSPANVAISLINFPFEVIADVVITMVSMGRYEFGAVEWKDRNVCIPVMHVIPKLPAAT